MWGKAMSELRRSKRKADFKYFLMPPTTHPSGFKTTEREIYLPNSMQIENAARRAKDKFPTERAERFPFWFQVLIALFFIGSVCALVVLWAEVTKQ
jgi:hypothetical protein